MDYEKILFIPEFNPVIPAFILLDAVRASGADFELKRASRTL